MGDEVIDSIKQVANHYSRKRRQAKISSEFRGPCLGFKRIPRFLKGLLFCKIKAFVEEKGFSVAWHYRRADPELGPIRAKELMDCLVSFTANIDVQVMQGSKVIEIRNAGVNKGVAGLYLTSKKDYDFILAIGDDWTDEDLFRVLPERAYSIRVGMAQSHARFNLYNHMEVMELLEDLIKSDECL